MRSLEEYIALAKVNHGHMCPGQVLGVRMAMRGLKELGVEDPGAHPRQLMVFVEIDRCATDAVGLVTGCSLGRRSLKFMDFGKVAATFIDLMSGRAVRVAARDDSREKARERFPGIPHSHRQQLEAYKVMDDAELFDVQFVGVNLDPADLPGAPRSRVACEKCGEGVNHGRERRVDGRVLCRHCAGESYYTVTSDQ